MATTEKNEKARRLTRGPGAPAVRIDQVDLKDAGVLGAMRLALPTRDIEDGGQWAVFLGANGVGKSTLLRAVTLGLADAAVSTPGILDLLEWNRVFGANSRVLVRSNLGDHRWQFDPRTTIAAIAHPAGGLDVFSYGSMRGTALGGPARDVDFEPRRATGTLFSQHGRLIHAATWLQQEAFRAERDLQATGFFNAVTTVLASLLPDVDHLLVEPDKVLVVSSTGRATSLNSLSDGYLTTLGWTIDLIARWADRYRDTGKLDENFAKDMPCVVLVDELDLHLHPKWQLDIIPRLRAAFPKTTFVVTTHNPLTLQGTRPGEVFVLQKDEATGQISITQRDVPPGTDANRLLTGDWFGLGSTLDESTLRKLDRHRELLLARRPESDPERRALEQELRVRLNGFADTSYERMALDVIAQLHDEKMQQRKDITAEDRERVVREVRARLAALDEPTGAREPATSAREPAPTYRPAKPPGKAPPKASGKPSSKPSPRKPTAKTKPAARTSRR